MRRLLRIGVVSILATVALISLSLPAHASFSLSFDNGSIYAASSIPVYATKGDMMDGMKVTAFFTGGGSQVLSWADTGSGSGGVSGTGWSLNESGDTFGNKWTLVSTSKSIDKVFIEGFPGNTVFDINLPSPGTTGSAKGWTVQPYTTGYDIAAKYTDRVELSGFSPVGDLWQSLSIAFTNNKPLNDGTFLFVADTDNALDLRKVSVPEPSILLLFGAGLVGLGLIRKKFKN